MARLIRKATEISASQTCRAIPRADHLAGRSRPVSRSAGPTRRAARNRSGPSAEASIHCPPLWQPGAPARGLRPAGGPCGAPRPAPRRRRPAGSPAGPRRKRSPGPPGSPGTARPDSRPGARAEAGRRRPRTRPSSRRRASARRSGLPPAPGNDRGDLRQCRTSPLEGRPGHAGASATGRGGGTPPAAPARQRPAAGLQRPPVARPRATIPLGKVDSRERRGPVPL